MAINHDIEILIDDGESDDFKAQALRRILNVLDRHTVALTSLATDYVTGADDTSLTTINVGDEQDAFSADFGIRVIFDTDTPVISKDTAPEIERALIQIFERDTISITHAASYTDGTRVYNVVITVT